MDAQYECTSGDRDAPVILEGSDVVRTVRFPVPGRVAVGQLGEVLAPVTVSIGTRDVRTRGDVQLLGCDRKIERRRAGVEEFLLRVIAVAVVGRAVDV